MARTRTIRVHYKFSEHGRRELKKTRPLLLMLPQQYPQYKSLWHFTKVYFDQMLTKDPVALLAYFEGVSLTQLKKPKWNIKLKQVCLKKNGPSWPLNSSLFCRCF
jgi:hypothetical protein